MAIVNTQLAIDQFGNRTAQTPSGSPSAPEPQAQTPSYGTNNHNNVSTYDPTGVGFPQYDLINTYVYDSEGRVCAINNPYSGNTQYIYDSEGRRVAKATITSLNCNPGSNGFIVSVCPDVIARMPGDAK